MRCTRGRALQFERVALSAGEILQLVHDGFFGLARCREAAIEAQTDHLVGLKENVIIGKLIPAGSGIAQRRRKQLARQQAAAARLAPSPVVAGVVAGSSVGGGSTLGLTLDSGDDE